MYFPTLMDVFDSTIPYGFFHPSGTNYDQHGYQLDNISVYQSLRTGEARHIMMETTQLNPISYFDTTGTKAITLWGGSTSSTSNMNLDLYWHEYNDIYAPSTWDNTILPSDSALPDSWTYGLPQSMNLVSGTSSNGLIPVHATTAKDGTFYILVNEMEGGEPVLKLYTTFASGVYTETTLTDFPDISAMQDDMCYRDLLDVQFGASLLEQRNGNFTTFTQDSGKWIGIEDSGEASEFAELEPLCFAFVNYNNVSGVGTIRNEVWYGEAYFSTEGTAVWLELVDDIVIAQGDNDAETNGYPKWVDRSESNPNPNPHNGQTIVANSFNPLWVSLGMTQYDENFADLATGGSLERAIPVLAYGVSCLDATEGLYGQLKIAAPISFSVTPLDLTLDVYRSEIHQYDTGYTGDDYSGSTTESPGLSTIIQ